MSKFSRFFSVLGAALVVVGISTDLVDGFRCTRSRWLLIAPIDLLYYIAAVFLGLGLVVSACIWLKSRVNGQPKSEISGRIQATAWILLALLFYGGFEPRLAGLALRVRVNQQQLIEFCARYRSGGSTAVANDPVVKWSSFPATVRETEHFVEVSWGASLSGSWGIRIDDQPRPVPRFVTGSDAAVLSATDRTTVFIGRY